MTIAIEVGGAVGSLVATATAHDPVDPIALFGSARAELLDASLWYDLATGRSLVGIGAAVRLTPGGPGRFERLAGDWASLLARIRITGPAADSPLAGPMLLGGATFRELAPSHDPLWAGFTTAVFDVPRVLVVTEGGHTVVTTVTPATGGVEAWPELERLLTRAPASAPGTPGAIRVAALEPDRPTWASSVVRITGAVGRGRLDKVVLARRVDLVAERVIDPVAVLRRLEGSERADPSPGARLPSTLFAFGHAERTFLGSSPEWLASVRGRRLRTMALAGTAPRGTDAARDAAMGDALLASEKDREEHAVVTTMLHETLAPLVTDLALPRAPRIVRSARVLHLVSDVTATLRPDVGPLEVVARLHPTPAVAGWPTVEALELLDEQTSLDRGWYAAPVGWVDRRGDGDVSVAIRSGVICGAEASLFAGCGIVADSEADREWDESTLKLRVMGDALGWEAT